MGERERMADRIISLELAGASLAVLLLLADVPQLVSVGLALMVLPWALRLSRRGRLTMRTPLDGPWALFALTAAMGVWAAYDRALAWPRFRLIVAGLGLYYALANAPLPRSEGSSWSVRHWSLGLCLFAALLGVYFVTQRDWAAGPVKFGGITSLGTWIAAHTPRVPGPYIHTNVQDNILAGALAVVWPINAALLITSRKLQVAGHRPVLSTAEGSQILSSNPRLHACFFLISLCALFLTTFALIMTGSRGAWLALATASGLWLLCRLRRRGVHSSQVRPAVVVACGVIGVGLLLVWSGTPGGLDAGRLFHWARNRAGSVAIGSTAVNRRLDLYRQTLTLVRDYPFSGIGLGCFTMVYSTYLLLVHVPFITLVDNLFLQIAVEQGVLGLVAFGWVVVAFFRKMVRPREQGANQPSAIGQAACWAVVLILVHGLVHGTLYASRALPLLFVPCGLAMASGGLGQTADRQLSASRLSSGKSKMGWRWAVTGLLLAVDVTIAALVWQRPLLGLVFSNLGALHQTQAELSVYEWPEWPIQDAVRREVDMSRPMVELRQALAYDPGNATANRRLGMIELSLGTYDSALAHLAKAYEAELNNHTTRQLLGEALIVNGQLDEGRVLWERVDNGQGQLGLRRWWYEHIGDEERVEWVRQMVGGG